jgi:RNA polymerase sigma factor (sigma-70 family)
MPDCKDTDASGIRSLGSSSLGSSSHSGIRQTLVLAYAELRGRLIGRLGSAELAEDVLHETYLRLDRMDGLGPIRHPKLYLLRMALNLAWRRLRAESRHISLSEAAEVLGIPDDLPDPARAAEAHFEVEALDRALDGLTPRRRYILLASRIEEIPLRQIAKTLGVSQRTVEIELKHALAHCALRLDREIVQRFGPRPRNESIDHAGD